MTHPKAQPFVEWLKARGHDQLPSNNPWEFTRIKINGIIHSGYLNSKGRMSLDPTLQELFDLFVSGRDEHAMLPSEAEAHALYEKMKDSQ